MDTLQFKKVIQTPNCFKNIKNTCEFIILHHTATPFGSDVGVIKKLTDNISSNPVSAHFLVNEKGEMYKFNTPEDCLRHAGDSQWGKYVGMNKYSIGIEVLGPDTKGFTDTQRHSVMVLMQKLIDTYNIKQDNILRHADVTWEGSHEQRRRDEHSPTRKIDIDNRFWKPQYDTFQDWIKAKLTFKS